MLPTSAPTTSPVTGGLSYETDIAPLKQRYFQSVFNDPRLARSNAPAQLSTELSRTLDESYKQQRGLFDMDQVAKQRQIQYESSVFELERAREKANRERTMMQDLKPVSDILSGIVNNPDLDPLQKKAELGKASISFAGQATTNPAIANAIDYANRSIVADQENHITPIRYLEKGADPDILNSYEATLGRPLGENEKLPFNIYSKGLTEAARKERQAREGVRIGSEREQRQYERAKSIMSNIDSAKLFTDELKQEDPTRFADTQSELNVSGAIAAFGTPEQIKEAQKANAKRKLEIAKTISTNWNTSQLQGSGQPATRPSAGSFATR